MNFGGGGGNGSSAARDAEQQRQARIQSGVSQIDGIFNQFDDNFYNKRRQAYLDFATPQLNDQYADARKQLTYALDRSGTTDSTARTTKEAELAKMYDTNRRTVDDNALNYENTARTNVAGAKSDLIGQLSASGDNASAVNSATARAASLSTPDAYSPLSQLFSGFTNALQTQASLEAAGAYSGGAVKPRYNLGLFSGSPGAVKVY